MSRSVGSVAWTSEELATLNKIMDEHPSNVSSGDWQPLVTEFFMRSPAYSARTKKAIRYPTSQRGVHRHFWKRSTKNQHEGVEQGAEGTGTRTVPDAN